MKLSSRRRVVVLVATLVIGAVSACGGGASRAPAPPKAAGLAAKANLAPSLTYVEIPRDWVEPYVTVKGDEASKWAADPSHASAVLPNVRHILVKSTKTATPAETTATKKKAEAALARVKRGDDFAAVARETSEDPGSKDRGGSYPGGMVESFVEPFRAAYAELAPGEFTQQLVESTFGWHIIKKETVTEDAILAAYRRSKASDLARLLANDVAARTKAAPKVEMAQALQESIASILGPAAAANARRPVVGRVARTRVEAPPKTEACARFLEAPREAVVVIPLAQAAGFLVGEGSADATPASDATAASDAKDGGAADAASAASAASSDESGGPWVCMKSELTARQLGKMMDKAGKASRSDDSPRPRP